MPIPIKKIFLFFLLCIFTFNHFAFSNPTEEDNQNLTIRAQGKALRFDRSRSFPIANIGSWGNIVLSSLDGKEEPLAFNRDGWGGGYEIAIEKALAPWNFELAWEQHFSEKKLIKSDLPGFGAGILTSMAFIDSSPHGTANAFGFFISANPVAGRNSPATTTLKYRLYYHDLAFYAGVPILKSERSELSTFAGPAYSAFSQNFRFETNGNNSVSGGTTVSATNEILSEHLFGARWGLRGKINPWKKLFFEIRQEFGVFVRHSRLEAVQSITNGGGNLGGGTTFGNLNERITVRQRDSGFASQIATQASMGYAFTEGLTVRLFYEYELWLELSRIQNPIVASNLRRVLGDPLSIEEGESARTHLLGSEIIIQF